MAICESAPDTLLDFIDCLVGEADDNNVRQVIGLVAFDINDNTSDPCCDDTLYLGTYGDTDTA